jgi:CheY-like chemotaxis protein
MHTKIFELFAQLDGPSGRAHGGLGIGLALVKQLVEMHGGTVAAGSSGESTGSTFTVRLPTIQQEAVTAPERAERETPTMRALKVLVVDDMPDVAQTVGWLLEEIGHDYRLVHDGRRAVDAAKDYRPDVILLDIGLPGMDGYQVCRALRQIPMFENTPIIAQTGWGQNQDKTLAAESGFTLHLTKPVPLEELETTLSTLAPAQRS